MLTNKTKLTVAMIKNCWILSVNGTPLFVHGNYEENKEVLISGFLGALQMLAGTLQKSKLNRIELADHTYFYSVFNSIIAVIEADPQDETESRVYQVLAQRLGRSFIDQFSDSIIVSWGGNSSEFQSFEPICCKITSELTQMLQQSQRDFLSKYFAEAIQDPNILGVVMYDLDQDEILSCDIPVDIARSDFEAFGSMLFSFLTRLGRELKAGEINEVLLRAKNYWIGGFRHQNLAVFMLFSQDYFGKVLPEFVTTPVHSFLQKT